MTAIALEHNILSEIIHEQLRKARAVTNYVSAHKQEVARNVAASIKEAAPAVGLGAATRIAVRLGLDGALHAAAFPATFLAGAVGTGVATAARENRRINDHGLARLYTTYVKDEGSKPATEHTVARKVLGAVGTVAKELTYGQKLEGYAVRKAFQKDERFAQVDELIKYVERTPDAAQIMNEYVAEYGEAGAAEALRQDLTDIILARIMQLEHKTARHDQKTRLAFNTLSAALKLLPDGAESVLHDIRNEKQTTQRKAIVGITAARIAKLAPRMLAGAFIVEAIAGMTNRAQAVQDVVHDSLQTTHQDDAAQLAFLEAKRGGQKVLQAPRLDQTQHDLMAAGPVGTTTVVTDTKTGCVTTLEIVTKHDMTRTIRTVVCTTPTATPMPIETPVPTATPAATIASTEVMTTTSDASLVDTVTTPTRVWLPVWYKDWVGKAQSAWNNLFHPATPTPNPTAIVTQIHNEVVASTPTATATPASIATEVIPAATPVPVIHFDYEHPELNAGIKFDTSVAGMPNFVSTSKGAITSIPMKINGIVPYDGTAAGDALLEKPPDGTIMQYRGLDLTGAPGETVGIYTCADLGIQRTLIKFVSVTTTDMGYDTDPTLLIAHADGIYKGNDWFYQPFERFRNAVSGLMRGTKDAQNNQWIPTDGTWRIYLTAPDGKTILEYKAVEAMVIDDPAQQTLDSAVALLQ